MCGLPSIEVRMYTCTYYYYFMSHLSDWKRARMCTENHERFGRIQRGSQLSTYVQHTCTSRRRSTSTCPTSSAIHRGDPRLQLAAHLFLDTTGSQGSRPAGPTGTSGDRRRKMSRSGMQALVRIQAYMLADILVAIPAVDLTVEAVVRGW